MESQTNQKRIQVTFGHTDKHEIRNIRDHFAISFTLLANIQIF